MYLSDKLFYLRRIIGFIWRHALRIMPYFNNKGYALIISMGFAFIMGILALSMISETIKTVRMTRDSLVSTQVEHAANSGISAALYYLKKTPTTANAGLFNMTVDSNAIDVNWNIFRKSAQFNGAGNFYVPLPGTGDAGDDCKTYGDYTDDENTDKDHACNWNKIAVGQTVNVPLWYYNGPLPINIKNPADPPVLNNLTLRLRTPCKNGSLKADCDDGNLANDPDERYKFNPPSDTLCFSPPCYYIDTDNTLIYWEIIGTKAGDASIIYVLQTYTGFNNDKTRNNRNSEIYESLIDKQYDAGNYEIINITTSKGIDQSPNIDLIINFLKNIVPWNTQTNNKPILKLNAVHSMVDDSSGEVIPYLEYQIFTDQPISNSKIIITATGKSADFSRTITVEKNQEGPISGFVIQN